MTNLRVPLQRSRDPSRAQRQNPFNTSSLLSLVETCAILDKYTHQGIKLLSSWKLQQRKASAEHSILMSVDFPAPGRELWQY